MEILLDNNIEIYRSICRKWRRGDAEKNLLMYQPYITDYVLMEYRRTLIRAIQSLITLIIRIPAMTTAPVGESDIRLRLGELLESITNNPSEYHTARRTKLLIQIVTTLMTDSAPYKIVWTGPRLARDLEFWAEELEHNIFYTICADGKIIDMRDTTNGYVRLTKCPLAEHNSALKTCSRDKLKCCIVSLIHGQSFAKIASILKAHKGRLYERVESNLKHYESSDKDGDRSIGQRLCWPAGDLVHATTCITQKSAILTSDRELSRLCKAADIRAVIYDPHNAIFS